MSGCSLSLGISLERTLANVGECRKFKTTKSPSLNSGPYDLPGTHIQYINNPVSPNYFFFLLHTYLGEDPAIKKAGVHDLSPALHSAATRIIGYVSASPFPEFLLAILPRGFFHHAVASCDRTEKECLK